MKVAKQHNTRVCMKHCGAGSNRRQSSTWIDTRTIFPGYESSMLFMLSVAFATTNANRSCNCSACAHLHTLPPSPLSGMHPYGLTSRHLCTVHEYKASCSGLFDQDHIHRKGGTIAHLIARSTGGSRISIPRQLYWGCARANCSGNRPYPQPTSTTSGAEGSLNTCGHCNGPCLT